MKQTIYIGKNVQQTSLSAVEGRFVTLEQETFYQIDHVQNMAPFFISLASDTDLWMYLSSNGALTAGRVSPDQALFPYYTDDKITDSAEITGSKSMFRVKVNQTTYFWEPFSDRYLGLYDIERSLAKSTVGNKILFTEENKTLGLVFSYQYENADAYGWIKKSSLRNQNAAEIQVELVDGLQNILPSGTDRMTQNTYSTLVDAYKKTELVRESSLALYRMESIMVDRAEPSESLRANIVWSVGLPQAEILLSSRQLNAFRQGLGIQAEKESKGVRGAYFLHSDLTLAPEKTHTWYFVADVQKDAVSIRSLLKKLREDAALPLAFSSLIPALEEAVAQGTQHLKDIVAQVDGVQETADPNGMARHFANTLFNTMRGGFYCYEYQIKQKDFAQHIAKFNTAVAQKQARFLSSLPVSISYQDLEKKVMGTGSAQLYRLFLEYLPITFSRRHGDPSRPWNLFHIRVNDAAGNKIISYQGNWRDIFQNWEALSLSYPAYINGIIAKFLNASTVDGYNPYKLTSEGIDWEVIVPEDPWSNIGYWGDHQIIYLLRLMELSKRYYPQVLLSFLNQEIFSYAEVPYRIKPYEAIVQDPQNTIEFDAVLHHSILNSLATYGSDARLLRNEQNQVVLVSFTEKILATLLAKLGNFIPEAGIWMNTMRPEWNDANNALVGIGASMVTLYYLRRFVVFLQELYAASEESSFRVAAEMQDLFEKQKAVFEEMQACLAGGFTPTSRRSVIDKLGKATSDYRLKVYGGFSGQKGTISSDQLQEFFQFVLTALDQSIVANQRTDGMYHAYNLVQFSAQGVRVTPLYEMLEGQVAVLSSMLLTSQKVVHLLDAMRASSLYRADQQSYTLYPNRILPSFLEKNNVTSEAIQFSPYLKKAVQAGDTRILQQDEEGGLHFHPDFRNARVLAQVLEQQPEIEEQERQQILDLYEKVFHHAAFTGRSGTFYKYEGLGSIYWHMVSKLLVAIHENIEKAEAEGASVPILERLKKHYAEVKGGIGAHKSPQAYGAFPFDAYSHTPAMAGAQQPGMTGQVKEDILNRFFELGIRVKNGQLSIADTMLDKAEFINEQYLSFTYCSIPFQYVLDTQKFIEVQYANGKEEKFATYQLDAKTSAKVFNRSKEIVQIIVHVVL